MLKKDVKVGERYHAKVSGQPTVVRILCEEPFGGWIAVNLATDRAVRMKTAARLRPLVGDRP